LVFKDSSNDDKVPLFVDLDGSLLLTDSLYESLFIFLKKNFLNIFLIPFWLFRGRAFLKYKLSENVTLNPVLLPFNVEVLRFLRTQSKRDVFLCTAANERIANIIADYLGGFAGVIASKKDDNLKGRRKLDEIKSKAKSFDYIGDSRADVVIFKEARKSFLVASPGKFADFVAKNSSLIYRFDGYNFKLKNLLILFRWHQWSKNLLLFMPVFGAHRFFDLVIDIKVGLAFIAFSLCCSSIYVINDILDLDNDRAHEVKKLRPLASGVLSLKLALIAVPLLLFLALFLASLLPVLFAIALLIYFTVTCCYSWWFKHYLFLDIITLACLYGLRVFAGGVAADIEVSPWLLAFSLFIFTSLACVKRYTEVVNLNGRIAGRAYLQSDSSILSQIGIASGLVSVLVLALYINANSQLHLYARPWLIWICCPVVMYWVARIWLLTNRGIVNQDPVLFALKDKVSYLVLVINLMIMYFAGWIG